MAKKKLTPAQKAAKTRKANQEKAMQELGFERKKVTRKRKPMTEEQRKAAAERLKLAREKRGHDGSKSVHHSIRDLPEDHFLHWKKVKQWIKECTSELKGIQSYKHSKVSKEKTEYRDLANYIDNMKRYLSSGHWGDYRYGAQRESKITRVSVAMAYDRNGRPKRMYGVWYPDIGAVWTKELEDMWGRDYDDEIEEEKRLEKERRTETE
tara:strand:- start:170 stop:796 length:627 start_codon:yes stop_codon:yes gene_type:complete